MEKIKCIFCNVGSDHIVIRENGFLGRKCAQCGLIYISPRPSLDEIINLYGHDSAHISAESHIEAEFEKRLYARHNLRLIRKIFRGRGAILEIGAGAGYFLDEARQLGLDPYAIEFNPIQAKFIREGLNIPCEESPLSPSTFAGNEFDIIYHSDVISHFFDPMSEFKIMQKRLKVGGLLVFQTGNLGDVDQRYFKNYPSFQLPDHLFSFSTKNLMTLLEINGFELKRLYRFGILPQLMVINLINKLQRFIKINKKANQTITRMGDEYRENQKNNELLLTRKNPKKSILNTIKPVLGLFYYFLRYKIGYILKSDHQPQTMIVIARKKEPIKI